MVEMIDAGRLIAKLDEYASICSNDGRHMVRIMKQFIDETPRVEVLSDHAVRHGEWLLRNGQRYCSVCGKKNLDEKVKSDFCHSCGADMRKKV